MKIAFKTPLRADPIFVPHSQDPVFNRFMEPEQKPDQRQGQHFHHPRVEPTNNAAEQAVRHGVLWRNSSFGTQSAAGSRFAERMMTAIATLRQQQRNVLDYLTQACQAALLGQPPPSLLPQQLDPALK